MVAVLHKAVNLCSDRKDAYKIQMLNLYYINPANCFFMMLIKNVKIYVNMMFMYLRSAKCLLGVAHAKILLSTFADKQVRMPYSLIGLALDWQFIFHKLLV